MALVLYWIQKWWRGWGLQRDRSWGVGHVFLCRAGCSCSLRKTDQKSPRGLHKTSTQGEGILMRLSGFSVVGYISFNHEFLTRPFWCDLKIWLMLFTRDKQFDNSNLTKASNWKPFPWSLFDTACVKWVCHLHPALKLWHNWIQPNLENIPDRSKSLLEESAGKCNSYYPEKKTKTLRACFG